MTTHPADEVTVADTSATSSTHTSTPDPDTSTRARRSVGGRPQNPTIRQTPRGWQVALSVVRGSKKTRQVTFATKAQADAWRSAGIAALESGQALPDPAPFQVTNGDEPSTEATSPAPCPTVEAVTTTARPGRPGSEAGPVPATPAAVAHPVPPAPTSFAAVADEWCEETYVKLNRAQPDRERDVRAIIANHLLPLLERHGWHTGADVTRKGYVDFLSEMAKGQPAAPADSIAAGAAEVTVADAARLTGASGSTIKRRIAAGAFPGSHLKCGIRMIPLVDLHSAGLMTGTPLKRGPRTAATGYSAGYLADVARVFRDICFYGVDTAGWTLAFDPAKVRLPNTAQEPATRGQVPLSGCVSLAEHLHPVHQIALWVIRLLCLRISEAYGIHVRDVFDDGTCGIARITRQGGHTFRVQHADGSVTIETEKDALKTKVSRRELVMPSQLRNFLLQVIDIFHTDADGNVDLDARLIPGLSIDGVGGAQAFRAALIEAADRAGVTVEVRTGNKVQTRPPTPKDLRAGTVTDLAWAGVAELQRKRYAGHAPGTDVHNVNYVLDASDMAATLTPVAEALETLINEVVPNGNLMVPTVRSCTTTNQAALRPDGARIDAALLDCGWLVAPTAMADGRPTEAMMTCEQAGELLGLKAGTVRRWARARRFPGATRFEDGSHAIPIAAVLAEQEAQRSRRLLSDVVSELHLDYQETYNRIKAHGWPLTCDDDRRLVVPEETEAHLLDYLAGQEALHARAVPLLVAARMLGLSPRIVEMLIGAGELRVDAERGPNKARFITRASIQARIDCCAGPSTAG